MGLGVGVGVGGGERRKSDYDALTNHHTQPDSHSLQAHGTGVLYQGWAGAGMNSGKSLPATKPHERWAHVCRQFAFE